METHNKFDKAFMSSSQHICKKKKTYKSVLLWQRFPYFYLNYIFTPLFYIADFLSRLALTVPNPLPDSPFSYQPKGKKNPL